MMRHLRWYGFVYFLLIMFAGSWVGQFFAQMIEMQNEAQTHGELFRMADFWPAFWAATFENWQSEFWQLFWQAVGMVLAATYIFKRSEADKNRMEAKIDTLMRALDLDPTDVKES